MKHQVIPVCLSIAILLSMMSCATPQTHEPSPSPEGNTRALRVGTFDSRGLALAYGRSTQAKGMLVKVAQLREEHSEATKQGQTARAKELESRVKALQEQIHRQVFQGAPIPHIMTLIQDDLPAIAKAANVDMIITDPIYTSPKVSLVDITLQMCTPFNPDERTINTIKTIIAKPLR